MNQLLIKILFLLVPLFAAVAANTQYYFNNIHEADGLSDNRVTSFLKDRTGFVWIGTKNGLNRYDGNEFHVFRPGPGNSISNEAVNDIVEDANGRIWVATMGGINIYDPSSNRWQTMMPADENVKDDLPSYFIWDLEVDENGIIWIVSDVWEFSSYDPIAKKFTYYDWPKERDQPHFKSISGYRSIQKIARKTGHEWWIGTTIGLFSLNTNTGKFTFAGGGYSGNLRDLRYDEKSRTVFLVTETGQVFSFNETSKAYMEIRPFPQPYPATRWDRQKKLANLLLMAYPHGLLEVNSQSGTAMIIQNHPGLSSSVLPGETNCVYSDDAGITWVASSNGISYFNSNDKSAEFIPLESTPTGSVSDGMSAAIYDSISHCYFVTSHSGKVFTIDDRTGIVTTINSISGKTLTACTNICMDREQNIWLLTETAVYRYDRPAGKFVFFPLPNEGDVQPLFTDMVLDTEGNYWFGTWRNGLFIYLSKEKRFYQFSGKERVYSRSITSLAIDPVDYSVWIGTFNDGVYRYDRNKDSFAVYKETPANKDYLQLNLIREMETDNSGHTWLSTFGAGLYVFSHGLPYEKSFRHITARDGLSNSNYHSITIDRHGRLWLLSGKGLSVVDQSGKFVGDVRKHPAMNFANYAPDDPYPKRISYNKTYDEILVPVAGGLLLYYPANDAGKMDFPVTLTGIEIDGRSVIFDSTYRVGHTVDIPYSSNSVLFRFAALDYAKRDPVEYEYKLHRNDKQWKSLGQINTVSFADLSPGTYYFQVRARTASAHTSANIVSFSFRIKPPFWKTWWFAALLVALAAYAVYRWTGYLRRKIRHQQILNYFATSLYGQNTVEDVCWDVAKNCISQLRFADCVIYLYDPQKNKLVQKAAYGPKNPGQHEIINAIEIPVGYGIVGAVAKTGKAEIINDTTSDSRYILDDQRRNSEIAVPIFIDGRIFGVIDSEHPKKNFYKKYHLKILQDIASICANKISKYIIEERLRSKISRDLHDEIGSALTSINILSKVAMEKVAPDSGIDDYLSKIRLSTSETMENMSDIVWAINPKNDKMEALMSRMTEFAGDICEAQRIDLEIKLPAHLENLSLDLAYRKNLFLIFKEVVNNAVKYSHCKTLSIRFDRHADRLLMEIADDGIGFDPETVSRGNGLYNMQERIHECNGTIKLESVPGKGTIVSLRIPITRFGGVTDKHSV